jgi:uncharacterized protein YdaT
VPWTTAQVNSKKKGLAPAEKKKWVAVANNVLKRTGSDSSAIKIANSKTKRSK